jgi:hypothetical protein
VARRHAALFPTARAVPRPAQEPPSMFYLGSILYVGTLFVNAIAILNEERFLARSASPPPS